LRVLFKPVVDFPLENLILAESTQFRSSQLTRSVGTLPVIVPQTQESNAIFKTKNDLKLCYENSLQKTKSVPSV
jgi:hypothetical protein